MLRLNTCDLPDTGSSLTILVGVFLILAAGLLVMGFARRSAHRLSVVAVVPVLLFAFAASPRATSDDCVTEDTAVTETTVEDTTTTSSTTTPASTTTTTIPRIALDVTASGIASISADDALPTTIAIGSWVGTISGSSTSFSVTGTFSTVGSVSGATCGSVSGSSPSATVTCTITSGATSVSLVLLADV